jgi:hypothetical protein
MLQIDINFQEMLKHKKSLDFHKDATWRIQPGKEFPNAIVYGAKNIGKYTHALNIIEPYSPSGLKYIKKLCINFNKGEYYIKISDVHYEIDFALLGCNAKQLWATILCSIKDVMKISSTQYGIILCKNFQDIHEELLDIFYSYMQDNSFTNLKFILLTNALSFIPNNILDSSLVINLQMPKKNIYNINYKNKDIVEIIENNYKSFGDKIIEIIINNQTPNYLELRETLYNLLTFNISIHDCLWYVVSHLISNKYLIDNHIDNAFNKIYLFFQYFNNNYRPIYHLERIIINLIIEVHEL